MILGLGYKARTGKGEIATHLVRRHGFVEASFANALKSACREIFRLSERQLYGDQKDVVDPFWDDTPRNILQKVGTECLRRGYREDVWVKALERELLDPSNPRAGEVDWVVSDCRFPNECEAIRRWGGKLVRVERPGGDRIATASHASETALDVWPGGWDYQICNDSSLDDLCAEVDRMVKTLRTNLADLDLSLAGPAGSWKPTEIGAAALEGSFPSFGKKESKES